MSKVQGVTLLLGAALGANLVLGAWVLESHFSPKVVMGQTVDSGTTFTVATGRLQGKGEADGFYILDHANQKLLVYFTNGQQLQLLHVRDLKEDMSVKGYKWGTPEYGFSKKEKRKKR